MSVHIVIDGYNLIRQSPTLNLIEHDHSLEEGRQALLERLVSYRKVKHHPMTVVFDGTNADNFMAAASRRKGIKILFSRPGELADSVIKRIVMRERERAVVVTSDREIADFAAQHGAGTIDSTEFEHKMQMATHPDTDQTDFPGKEEGWKPTTKKKGPSRRMPKRQRKSRVKKRKL
jgi:predicted RNA-binding protein with PIN domain